MPAVNHLCTVSSVFKLASAGLRGGAQSVVLPYSPEVFSGHSDFPSDLRSR